MTAEWSPTTCASVWCVSSPMSALAALKEDGSVVPGYSPTLVAVVAKYGGNLLRGNPYLFDPACLCGPETKWQRGHLGTGQLLGR